MRIHYVPPGYMAVKADKQLDEKKLFLDVTDIFSKNPFEYKYVSCQAGLNGYLVKYDYTYNYMLILQLDPSV